VGTDENVSDVLTKHLAKEPFDKHVTSMGFDFQPGRAEEARKVCALQPKAVERGGVREYGG